VAFATFRLAVFAGFLKVSGSLCRVGDCSPTIRMVRLAANRNYGAAKIFCDAFPIPQSTDYAQGTLFPLTAVIEN
jgi:hypothetical protein